MNKGKVSRCLFACARLGDLVLTLIVILIAEHIPPDEQRKGVEVFFFPDENHPLPPKQANDSEMYQAMEDDDDDDWENDFCILDKEAGSGIMVIYQNGGNVCLTVIKLSGLSVKKSRT